MGAEVHLMYRQPLPLRGFDMECRKHVADNIKGRGIKLYPGTAPTRYLPSALLAEIQLQSMVFYRKHSATAMSATAMVSVTIKSHKGSYCGDDKLLLQG